MDQASPEQVADWPGREARWRRRLRRLRFDAEPIEEQLARLRRVTIALTAVPTVIRMMFVAIFRGVRPARRGPGGGRGPAGADRGPGLAG